MKLLSEDFRFKEILFILCIEVVLVMMGMGLMGPILPQYARSFGVSITLVGLLMTAFGVARIIVDIPAGRLSEKLGRRPVIIMGPLFLAVGAICFGLATDYWQLLVSRLIQGVGSALYTTAAGIILTDITSRANRGRIMALYEGSLLVGFGLGPVLGGFVAQYFGLQVPFFILAGLAILASLWAWLRMPETRSFSVRDPVNSTEPHAGPVSNFKAIGAVLRNVNFISIAIVTFFVFFMRAAAKNQMLPIFGSERLGLSSGQIGMLMSVLAILEFVLVAFSGRLSDRFGRKAIIIPGCLLAGVSLFMVAVTGSYALLIFDCVLLGAACGLLGSNPLAYIADIMPNKKSTGVALYRFVGDLGFVTGPILLGWLADIRGIGFSFIFNAVMLFLAALVFQVLAKPDKIAREAKPGFQYSPK